MNCVHSAGNTNQSDTNSSKFFSPALQEYTKTLIKTAKQPDTALSTLINSIEDEQLLASSSTCKNPPDESIIISSDTSDDDDNNNSKNQIPITTTTTATSTIKVQNSKEKLPQQKVLEQKISKLEVITSNKSNASVNCNSMREKQHKRQTDKHVTQNEGERRHEGGGNNVNKINKQTPKNVKKKVFNLDSQQKLTSFFTPVKK